MRKKLVRILNVIVMPTLMAACLLAADAGAQVATGTILGNITDTSGAAVPGATVTATNVDTQVSRGATTDELRQYAPRLFPLGNDKIDVALDGFKSFSRTVAERVVRRASRMGAERYSGRGE